MKKGFSTLTSIIILAVVIALAIYLLSTVKTHTPAVNEQTATEQATSTPKRAFKLEPSVSPARTQIKKYANTAHLFEFQYPGDWAETGLVSFGLYSGSIAFAREDQLETLKNVERTSEALNDAIRDRVIYFRIVNNTSINQVIEQLYGSGVVVMNAPINGKNIAHVMRTKESDPTNWSGGSTEAYIFRNTLGEAVVIEANYVTEAIPQDSELRKVLGDILKSLKLR